MAPIDHHHHLSVKILELSTVAPLSDHDHQPFSSPKSLPLTFFDILWLRFPPTQRLFFYDFPLTQSSFLNTLLPKLKHSLSLILQHYLPLAGNLFWPHNSKPIILFSEGDGVLLTVAESDADFDYLSGDGFREAAGYHSLVSELPVSNEGVAVISLQITLFPNKGFSIGITGHHAILDGRSSTSFIKSWAQICSSLNDVTGAGLSKTELTPFYDRTVVDDPKGLEEIYMKGWESVDGPNNKSLKFLSCKTPPGLIRCTVELTRENLENLKKWVLKNHDDDDEQNEKRPFHLSSFTLTCAYLWVCAVKSKNLRETEEEMEFVFAVDVRSRIEPPLPMNYFGNCILGRRCCIKGNDLSGEKGLIFATKAISERIKSLEEGSVMEEAERLISIIANLDEKGPGENFYSIAGSPRFEVYKNADFGWGKPRKVEVVSVDSTRAFSLAESRNGNGGIEIGFVRKIDEIQRFAAFFVEGLQSL